MTTMLCGLLGAGVGLGVWLVITGWRGTPPGHQPLRLLRGWDGRRVGVVAVAAVAGAVVTEWVVGAVLIGMAVWALPRLLASGKQAAHQLARVEAVAGWTEQLRDTLAAAAGIEQAILAGAPVAPEPIHAEVNALALRLETGHRLAPSLRTLADDLADPTADLVISALQRAATQQARHVGELLGSLAVAAREQVSMRQRVETSRADTRASVRMITGTTCVFVGGLIVLSRDYLSAYDTVVGQLALLAIGGLFAAGFAGLTKITATRQPARFLTPSAVEGG
jgi:Flp pilus assembly protein TadB